MSFILTRDIVTDGGRSFRRELAVRCFAQTEPPSSCLVAEETRLHRMADGRWVLEAWNYLEDGVDRWFRCVSAEQASWWLRRNGFDDASETAWYPQLHGQRARGTGFVAAAAVAADVLAPLAAELEDAS